MGENDGSSPPSAQPALPSVFDVDKGVKAVQKKLHLGRHMVKVNRRSQDQGVASPDLFIKLHHPILNFASACRLAVIATLAGRQMKTMEEDGFHVRGIFGRRGEDAGKQCS